MEKKIFTTFEASAICQVFHTSIINWINKGQLKAYKTPGKHRRIQKEDLVKFMKKFNIRFPPGLEKPKTKIIVVDDDTNILKVFEKAFFKWRQNIDLKTTVNGLEAMVLVGKEAPDLIILDVVMPKMDGIEVCRTLKSNPETRTIKIVSITGEDLLEDQEIFLKNNVEAVFRKPFSPLQVIERVKELLNLKEELYETK